MKFCAQKQIQIKIAVISPKSEFCKFKTAYVCYVQNSVLAITAAQNYPILVKFCVGTKDHILITVT